MKEVDISGITTLTKDRDTSIRLYRTYQRRYAGKSATWVVEKVITDLQRERGGFAKTPVVRTRHRRSETHRGSGLRFLQGEGFAPPPITRIRHRWSEAHRGRGFRIIKGGWADRNLGWMMLGCILISICIYAFEGEQRPQPIYEDVNAIFNLEGPYLYQKVERGAVITIQNESPEPIQLTLKGEKTYSLTLSSCSDCQYYNSAEEMPDSCENRGPKSSLVIEPGVYEATLDFMGTTRTGRGDWTMVDGWEQFGCYYSVYNESWY